MGTDGVLPTFLVIGAQKAGTTSLTAVLRRHPDVFLPKQKELHFFSRTPNYERGLAWYETWFESGAGAVARGEATPEYLYVPEAPARAAESLGTQRLVVLLRDPVDRAYSHYLHAVRVGITNLSFDEALAAEDRRLAQFDTGWWSFVDRGRYLRQLLRWERRFGREAMHVELFEDLVRDPQATVGRIMTFIGVEPDRMEWDGLPRRNPAQRSILPRPLRRRVARLPRGPARRRLLDLTTRPLAAPPPSEETVARLRETFAPEVAALGTWLGRSLEEWRS